MAKYDPLGNWFRTQPMATAEVLLTFAEIERVISDDLPPCARWSFRWWDNNQRTAHSDTWLNCGWETVMVDMENEKIKFQRK